MEQRQAKVSNALQIKHRQGFILSLARKAKEDKRFSSQRGQFFQNLKRCKRTAKLSKSVDLGAEFYKCPKFIGKTTRIMA